MRYFTYIALLTGILGLATSCIEKKEDKPADADKKIIITEQKQQTDEAVQIPMHGTNNDKAGNERR